MRQTPAELGATPLGIFDFLARAAASGKRGVLVTMTDREGSSLRALGSHMAVLADGRYAGSFSAACIEAAIVSEARETLAAGCDRIVRFGKGSPYIDIRLPCGGGIDLLFQPSPAQEIARAAERLRGRSPIELALAPNRPMRIEHGWSNRAAGWQGGEFLVRHAPPLRLVIAGEGGEPLALARLAEAYGAEIELLSPDGKTAATASNEGYPFQRLRGLAAPPALALDAWTALALLFHEHEWETALLAEALETEAFWIGAMGSERAHEARLQALADRGVPAERRARVHGPIGLIPAARDPATLALSALAEIAGDYQRLIR
ncbi:XdhC family protein [Sphingosinicella terrae]|uniref:XdhC family protein n=1 Tax=Sphingosinicella terrae TaxID=2172047 RepID=UPI000E0CF5EA|nr:XdhC family protein [Sphingosinicella terrae]